MMQCYLYQRSGHNIKRGTILIEVLISVAILSTSIVFILQSLTASSRAASRAKHYIEASNFLENEIVEFIVMPRDFPKKNNEPVKGNFSDYLFFFSEGHQPFQGEVGLQTIVMTQEWGQGRGKGSVSLPLVYYDQRP